MHEFLRIPVGLLLFAACNGGSGRLHSTLDLLVMDVMWIALLSCALIGCAYTPGSFASAHNPFPGQRATVGCLDIAVERRTDLPIGPVLAYQFANRCDHPTTVDLGSIAVLGRDAAGTELALRAYDPRAELHPITLDARNLGTESLAYPANRAIPQLCVDIASVAPSWPSRWLCFGGTADTVAARLP
jgi:hypothetical protein